MHKHAPTLGLGARADNN